MRHLNKPLLLILSTLTLTACNSQTQTTPPPRSNNPPAPNINTAQSDPQAIAIADQVMAALGGRKAWDNTRYITFNFFGRRQHLWDKQTGAVRIEYTNAKQQKIIYLMNINTRQGRVLSDAQGESTDPGLLERGYGAWVNDTYWLTMPYKLKDDGVTLKYLGEGQTAVGQDAHILELTFAEVGVTPLNKYHIYVNQESNLVEQWDFYMTADAEEPRMSTPWENWQSFGPKNSRIKLASGRGGERTLPNINVLTTVPANAFTSFDPIDWEALAPSPTDGP